MKRYPHTKKCEYYCKTMSCCHSAEIENFSARAEPIMKRRVEQNPRSETEPRSLPGP